MPVDLPALCDDLAAEQAVLDALVADLDESGWRTATPAAGWDVRDTIAHLAFFDVAATLAGRDPAAFERDLLGAVAADHDAFMRSVVERGRSMAGRDVLAWWRSARSEFLSTYRALDPSTRVPWFGPPMSAASKVTARIMETWAHGQDVVDGLGLPLSARPATARLRHVAHIAVGARPFSYMAHGMETPSTPVRVQLTPPPAVGGDAWTWGPEVAPDRVSGPALDFCLVLTQRRHVDDTALVASGAAAEEWLRIGQAFAGPPGEGRRPGQFG
jgi:uncharacterized protein (TIGR03084 family)